MATESIITASYPMHAASFDSSSPGMTTMTRLTRAVAARKTVNQGPQKGSIPQFWDGCATVRCRQAVRDFLGFNGKTL
jgi:hypothetical protein